MTITEDAARIWLSTPTRQEVIKSGNRMTTVVVWLVHDLLEQITEMRLDRTKFQDENNELRIGQAFPNGDLCDTCGMYSMIRTGTCLTCQNCGVTTGC